MTDKELFAAVFVRNPEGAQALKRLQSRFYDGPIYQHGGHEADRHTAFCAGSREVVAYILRTLQQD